MAEKPELMQFRWSVATDGYEWREAADIETERRSVWLLERSVEGSQRAYCPLRDEPTLFRTFADVGADPGRALGFANRYGMLGAQAGAVQLEGQKRVLPGEIQRGWFYESCRMDAALDLVEAAEESDAAALDSWISISGSRAHYYRELSSGNKLAVAVGPPAEPSLASYIDEAAPERAALFVVQKMANAVLDKHTSWRLMYSPETDRMATYVAPSTLLAAMWIQLAESISERRRYVRCSHCGAWIWLRAEAKGGFRANRELCSHRCKIAAYRDRKRRAKELRAEGMAPSAIAREIGSDTQTVRGWLGMAPHGRT